jgi:hypothetical protein
MVWAAIKGGKLLGLLVVAQW